MSKCQCRHHIADIVLAHQAQFLGQQQIVKAEGNPGTFIVIAGTERIRVNTVKTETQEPEVVPRHGRAQGIVQIDHGVLAAVENSLFGLEIGHLVRVAIHVIIADVQHRGRQGIQFPGGFELEAR